ncbi:MAG: ATP-binding protein [Gammaproteobacteria bacterium]|nr:ATP-binding protein [Gammaproteobacteria bacterium]
MLDFKRNKLAEFVKNDSGEFPPVFVGREDILEDILDQSHHSFKRGSAPAKNAKVINGAPGAGKTSLLTELSQRGRTEENHPRTVVVTSAEIKNRLPDVMKAIVIAASKPKNQWLASLKTRGSDLGQRIGNVSFLSFRADFAQMTQPRGPDDLYTLARMVPTGKWEHPVILAIDEAQRLRGDITTPHAEFLQAIHDANRVPLPLTLVFAGLGDTQERVNDMGITNCVHVFAVGALNRKEQAQVVDGFCEHFGVEVGTHRERLHSFFEPTDGWPRHIYWAQCALAETLLVPDVDGHLDKVSDWSTIEQRRDRLRIRYYEDRRSLALKISDKLVGAVMKTVAAYNDRGIKINFSRLADQIHCYSHEFKIYSSGWCVPEDFGTGSGAIRRYIEHLVHQGALAEDVWSNTYRCPIPSFQSHLISRANFTTEESMALEQTLNTEIIDS